MEVKVETRVLKALRGFYESWVIFLGLEMGIFKALAERGPASPLQLAAMLSLNEQAVSRWARAAVSLGILDGRGEEVWLAEEWRRVLLQPDAEDYRGGDILYAVGRTLYAGGLLGAFRDGLRAPSMSELVEEATRWEHKRIVGHVIPEVVGLLNKGNICALDVGCGTGHWLECLLRTLPQARAVGVDPDREALEAAGRRLKPFMELGRVELHRGYIEDFEAEGHFDLVNCCEVLSVARSPLGVLRKCRGLLSPKGLILVTEGLIHDRFPGRPRLCDRLVYGVDLDLLGVGGRLFSPRELEALFSESGLQVRSRIRVGDRLWSFVLCRGR
jgi:SAM-dependent methyltransferase